MVSETTIGKGLWDNIYVNGGWISYACKRLWSVRRISDSGRHSDEGQQEHPQVLKPQADQAACFSLEQGAVQVVIFMEGETP